MESYAVISSGPTLMKSPYSWMKPNNNTGKLNVDKFLRRIAQRPLFFSDFFTFKDISSGCSQVSASIQLFFLNTFRNIALNICRFQLLASIKSMIPAFLQPDWIWNWWVVNDFQHYFPTCSSAQFDLSIVTEQYEKLLFSRLMPKFPHFEAPSHLTRSQELLPHHRIRAENVVVLPTSGEYAYLHGAFPPCSKSCSGCNGYPFLLLFHPVHSRGFPQIYQDTPVAFTSINAIPMAWVMKILLPFCMLTLFII